MPVILEKVTVFVLGTIEQEKSLLLLQHPFAGIQIPAGTVEQDETPRDAALREACEETGLAEFAKMELVGEESIILPDNKHVLHRETTLYSRPDARSFDWVRMRRGIVVRELRRHQDYVQVQYSEADSLEHPESLAFSIIGWVPQEMVTSTIQRHYFLTHTESARREPWRVHTDHHDFMLFWAPLNALPPIVDTQAQWTTWLLRRLESSG